MECYLLKVVLLHGCFSRFLNRTNGTKSSTASEILRKKQMGNDTRRGHKAWSSQVWLSGTFSCGSAFPGYCAPVRGGCNPARGVWGGVKIGLG